MALPRQSAAAAGVGRPAAGEKVSPGEAAAGAACQGWLRDDIISSRRRQSAKSRLMALPMRLGVMSSYKMRRDVDIWRRHHTATTQASFR